MKLKSLLVLSTLALTLAACGSGNGGSNSNSAPNPGESSIQPGESSQNPAGSSTKDGEGWTGDELKLLSDYAYGVDLPYIAVEGSKPLTYDADLVVIEKIGGTSTGELLANYAKLFDNTWEDYSYINDEDYGTVYLFEKEITTKEGKRYVDVQFYGGEYDDLYEEYLSTDDGSGTFVLQVYDPYYYEWPEQIIYELVVTYGSIEFLPKYTTADYYELEDYWFYFGIFCYTSNKNAAEEYDGILTAAGYEFEFETGGWNVYVSKDGMFEVEVSYNEDFGSLDIYVIPTDDDDDDDDPSGGGTEVNPGKYSDKLTQAEFGMVDGTSGYGDYSYTSKTSGVRYDGYLSAGTGIQMRAKTSDSGIIAKSGGATCTSIVLETNAKVFQTRTIGIYASSKPFSIEDMYNPTGDLKQITTIVVEASKTYTYNFTQEFKYVGIRSEADAVYFDSITFNWEMK